MCSGVCVVINLFKIIACIVRDKIGWHACADWKPYLDFLKGISDFIFVNINVCTNTVGIGHACKLSIHIYIYIYIYMEYYKEIKMKEIGKVEG